MKSLTKYTSAAFGMALLAGLAWYQGQPDLATGEDTSLVGTALIEPANTKESKDSPVSAESAQTDCDPSKDPEDPDFQDCEKLSQK